MSDEKDYHGHPNYNMIFYALVALMIATVIVDELGLPTNVMVLSVFGIAVVKAYLVMANFMHLKYEPKLVDLFPYLSIVLIVVLFFGVYPDSVAIPLDVISFGQ
jgi:caa(3)-type oxidase subunit IV